MSTADVLPAAEAAATAARASTALTATYRIQVREDFDLYRTAELLDYLHALGVSHVYVSPLLQATPGSQHGYDVVDHRHVDEARGGESERRALVAAAREAGLGVIVDIVPNHTGVADPPANRAWWDVLALGPQSVFTRWFDIDWSGGRLIQPILGAGPDELDHLRVEDGELRYYEHRFPLAAGTADRPAQRQSPADYARLVHDRQHYELVSYRRGDSEVNYRRFFAVSSLAGLRVEDPLVFDATHAEILRWTPDLDGIRVDHPDGLLDPAAYLRRLRSQLPEGSWLFVEKILEPGETLPADWPVDGTTGYDALALVDGVLSDEAAQGALDALQQELTGSATDWAELVHDCKLDVATGMQAAELRRLTAVAAGPADDDERRDQLRATLAELLACFPVYRSYLPEHGAAELATAVAECRRRRPELGPVIDRLHDRLHDPGEELALRFQQQTGAVMAKGVEDTAYYRYTRFIAACEVGRSPARISLPVRQFHASAAAYAETSMTTLSTHDTKRSEDVRARLAVLAEIPARWAAAVREFSTIAPLSDGAIAHLLWQTVVGAWPIERERLHGYAEKAAREARTATSWDHPDADFERAMHQVIDRTYDDDRLRGRVEDFVEVISAAGRSNSLSAKLIQLTMPGVPDVYQGTECFDNSLVDPDNRRWVDFDYRRGVLAALDVGDLPPVDASGRAKLLVTSRALRARRDRADLFSSYTPVTAEGAAASHALAFDRGGAITVATRLPLTLDLAGGWRATRIPLPAGDFTDAITGRFWSGTVDVADLLDRYPVALLLRR